MKDPVAFLLFVSLLAIVFPKGNHGNNQEEEEDEYDEYDDSFIREDFNSMDQNKDNYIDREEFSTDVPPGYIEYVFKQYDVDGDGKLNYEEYIEEHLDYIESEESTLLEKIVVPEVRK